MNRKARPAKYQSPRDYIAANFASRTMRWTGIIVAAFLVFHLADLTWGWRQPRLRPRRRLPQPRRQPQRRAGRDPLHRRQHRPRHPPVPRRLEPLPVARLEQPPLQPLARGFAVGFATVIVVGNISFPIAVLAGVDRPTMRSVSTSRMTITLDAKIPDGPDRGQVGQPQVRRRSSSTRPTSASSRSSSSAPASPAPRPRPRWPSSATRSRLHLPRLAPPGPLDRRAGRHQRRQELPGRRRQHLPPLLRHRQGRRLPRPRGATCYRLAQVSRRTSSTSASPRACRSPASTAACSTTAPSAAPR